MELFIFGFICIVVVEIAALALAFKEHIKEDRKANQNLTSENLESAFDNLQIYSSNTENINSSYKTIHFLCKHCKNDVSVNFQFLDLSAIENVNFTVKCPLCNKLITTVEIKDGVIYFF